MPGPKRWINLYIWPEIWQHFSDLMQLQQYTLQIQPKNGKSTKHWVLFGVLGGSSTANVGRSIKHGLHVQRRMDKPRTSYSNSFEKNGFIF
jgi:hypothetical protein